MFEFTIREANFLNDFKNAFSSYLNKAYAFCARFLANPDLNDRSDTQRLLLIVINKSVFQNLFAFLKLNESNFQLAAFSCLESAVYAMRLYNVLSLNEEYMHAYITESDFSLAVCEAQLLEKRDKYERGSEEFSLKEFYNGLEKFNGFEYKNRSVAAHITNDSVYLGLSCSDTPSEIMQNEVRKNLVGAYLSLQKHMQLFFNGGLDKELEETEDKLYSMFIEYIKRFSD